MLRLLGRVAFAAVAATWVVACAQLPADDKVKAFAKAASSATDTLRQAADVNAELAQRVGDDFQVASYIDCEGTRQQPSRTASATPGAAPSVDRTSVVPIAARRFQRQVQPPPPTGFDDIDERPRDCSSNRKPSFQFPPPPAPAIDPKALTPATQLIKAINDYATALGEAADKGTIQELEAAAATLAAAAGAAIIPVAGPAALPLIGPSARMIGRGLGLALASTYAAEIQNVIRATDGPLNQATGELKIVIGAITKNSDSLYRSLKRDRKFILNRIRYDSAVSRSVAYAEFRNAANDLRAMEGKIAALKSFGNVLDKLAKAHHGLIEGNDNSAETLRQFIQAVKEVQELLPILKANRS
jgi:hypothetical protein